MLVDKDRKPQWKHKSFSEVDYNSVVKRFFDRSEEIDVDTSEEATKETAEATTSTNNETTSTSTSTTNTNEKEK